MEWITHAVELFGKGGIVMYPLLACSLLVVAIVVERLFYFHSVRLDAATLLPKLIHELKQGNWKGAVQLCTSADGPLSVMLTQTLAEPVYNRQELEHSFEGSAARFVAKLRSRLAYLDTIVTLAPLLGLLGTVTGMIQSFSILTIKAGQPTAITGGVGEALVATATGLIVAIIALIGHSVLNDQIEDIITNLEDSSSSIVSAAVQGMNHEV